MPGNQFGFGSYQMPDPFAQLQGMAALMQVDTANRASRRQDDVRKALSELSQSSGGDFNAIIGGLSSRGYVTEAQELRSKWLKSQTEEADLIGKRAENMAKMLANASALASSIVDDESLMLVRPQIERIVGPDLAAQLGDRFDPERIAQAVQWGSTEAGRNQRLKDAADAAHKALELEQAQKRDAPKIFQEWTNAAGNAIAATRNTQELAQTVGLLRKRFGVGADVLEQFGDLNEWTPEVAERAGALTLTAAEEAEIAGAAATRAETARANRTREGIDAGRLDVERQRLELERLASGDGDPAVAQMVIRNPDLLKDLPLRDRSRVIKQISSMGGELASARTRSTLDMIDAATETLKSLGVQIGEDGSVTVAPGSGFAGSVGAKGPTSLFGWRDTPISGSAANDYAARVDQLKSQLTLPRLEFMRGLGPMSDREFATLTKSATSLGRDLSEAAFRAELQRLAEGLIKMRGAIASGAGGGVSIGAAQAGLGGPAGGTNPFRTGAAPAGGANPFR